MRFLRRSSLSNAILLGMLIFTSCTLFAGETPDEAVIKAKVERYLTRYFQLTPQEWVVVNQIWSVENPPSWGLFVTRKQGGKTSDDVYMLSKDLKYLSLGRILDFTEDLDAKNLAKVNFQNSPSQGPSNAPVTLVEYCDLQCPDCKAMVENLNKVLPAYAGKVRIVFKNYPLMNRHAWAEAAAIAARCAYQQKPDAFWNFYNFFYTQQDSVNTQNIRDKSLLVAKEAGLNTEGFASCYDTEASLPAIEADVFESLKLGVKGTPTLLVNGRFVFNEDMRENDYRKLIDEALQPSR